MKKLVAIAAIALVPLVQAAGIPGQGTWETTLLPRDIDKDGIVDAYFDTTLNISWLADWNLFGQVTESTAIALASRLDVQGVTGWRQPLFTPGAQAPQGSWLDPKLLPEFAHLNSVTLGNTWGMKNTGPFRNMVPYEYFAKTVEYSPLFASFDMYTGGATYYGRSNGLQTFFVAVHDGDVAAVPEPATVASLLLGLGLVLGARRLRQVHGRSPE